MSAFMLSDENFDAIAATLAGWYCNSERHGYDMKQALGEVVKVLRTPARDKALRPTLDKQDSVVALLKLWVEELNHANAVSVNYRYSHHSAESMQQTFGVSKDNVTGYKCNIRRGKRLSIIQLIKVLHCLDYQSCEPNNWPETELAKELAAVTNKAAQLYVRTCAEYDAAKWGI
jgi:hypothetical protein